MNKMVELPQTVSGILFKSTILSIGYLEGSFSSDHTHEVLVPGARA